MADEDVGVLGFTRVGFIPRIRRFQTQFAYTGHGLKIESDISLLEPGEASGSAVEMMMPFFRFAAVTVP